MMTLTYRFAGINVRITSLYPDVHEYCRDYLTEGDPDFSVSIAPDDLSFEKSRFETERPLEAAASLTFPDGYWEELAVYRKIAEQAPFFDTLLFHGSAVAVDGIGYLFAAPSGTGKSTHTRLWREVFGTRAVMVNDDKPLLRFREDGILVYGTPWNGKHRLSANVGVPLKAICFLERAAENTIDRICPKTAFPLVFRQCYRPADGVAMEKTLSLLDRLPSCLPFFLLRCNRDPEAARIAYQAMKG